MIEPWFFEVLPNRPPPYADECLSSYLLRLTELNGIAYFWDFASDLFPRWHHVTNLWRMRWEYPPEGWGRIPLRTHFSLVALQRLTVAPWVEKFRPPLNPRADHVPSPGYFLRGAVHPFLQVCPLCLQEKPYWRLRWRLCFARVCVEHRCLLQTRCHRCGRVLRVMHPSHHLLRCASCHADLRDLLVVKAPPEVVAAQARQEKVWQFLLDPETTLVALRDLELAGETFTLPQAIGLKFRYLRLQTGLSVREASERLGVDSGMLTSLERGKQTPLPLFLSYLESLGCTWQKIATLKVPEEFIRNHQMPPHLALRICPTLECPNHTAAPSTRVVVLLDLSSQGIVRLRCTTCGHSFTRRLDGQLSTKPRKPALDPVQRKRFAKSTAEILRFKELGLQGMPNRQIAHALGWGEKTVRLYWIALGMAAQVHQAQAARRKQKVAEHHADVRAQVEAILQKMVEQKELITLRRVGEALGHNCEYLQTLPDLAAYVHRVAQQHNPQVEQRHRSALWQQIADVIAQLKEGEGNLTIANIERRVALAKGALKKCYPELHQKVSQVVGDYQVRVKTERTRRRCERMNEMAARLIAQGARPTVSALLKAANMTKSQVDSHPPIRDLLQQWVGDFAPRD